MHRFQLRQKNAQPNRIYALINGVYYGGGIDTQADIICDSSAISGHVIRLIVSDDGVKLSSIPNSSIKINGTMQKTSLTNTIMRHGDLIGIGRDVFELVEREPPMCRRNMDSGFPCYHPYNPRDELKTLSRIDCVYPKCFFACWCIADLNEHTRSDEGHKGKMSGQAKRPILAQYDLN